MAKKQVLFVVIRTEVGKPNSTFWAELKCYFFQQSTFLSYAPLKFEENLYLHYITESIHIT